MGSPDLSLFYFALLRRSVFQERFSSPCGMPFMILFQNLIFDGLQNLAHFLVKPLEYTQEMTRQHLPLMRVGGWLRACKVDFDLGKNPPFTQMLEAIGIHIPRAVDALWMTAFQPSFKRLVTETFSRPLMCHHNAHAFPPFFTECGVQSGKYRQTPKH